MYFQFLLPGNPAESGLPGNKNSLIVRDHQCLGPKQIFLKNNLSNSFLKKFPQNNFPQIIFSEKFSKIIFSK